MFTKDWHLNRAKLGRLRKSQIVHFGLHVIKRIVPLCKIVHAVTTDSIRVAEDWLRYKDVEGSNGNLYGVSVETLETDETSKAVVFAASALANIVICTRYGAAGMDGWAAAIVGWSSDAGVQFTWLDKLYNSILGKPPFPQSWKTRDTISIAKDMLASRNLKDMPILADALEDAGCTDSEILYHLRNDEGLWCLGDWVLVNLGG